MKKDATLDALMEPIKSMPLIEQLKFWRRFRVIHRRRIAKTEAALCPELLKAVDDTIENLRQHIVQGV